MIIAEFLVDRYSVLSDNIEKEQKENLECGVRFNFASKGDVVEYFAYSVELTDKMRSCVTDDDLVHLNGLIQGI